MKSKWRVNVLCLIGAALGAVSIFLVWVGVRIFTWRSEFNLIEILNETMDSSGGEGLQVLISCLLVLLGVLIAFLSPIGGVLELTGTSLFLEWAVSMAGRFPDYPGVYVAIASGIIVLVSAIMPVGFGYECGSRGLRGRILTFSSSPSRNESDTGEGTKPEWAERYCRHCGRPVAEEATICPGCGRPPA